VSYLLGRLVDGDAGFVFGFIRLFIFGCGLGVVSEFWFGRW